MKPVLLTIGEAAALLSSHTSTLRRLCVDRRLRSLRVGKKWLISRRGLLHYADPAVSELVRAELQAVLKNSISTPQLAALLRIQRRTLATLALGPRLPGGRYDSQVVLNWLMAQLEGSTNADR